jgi:hypothetical protein
MVKINLPILESSAMHPILAQATHLVTPLLGTHAKEVNNRIPRALAPQAQEATLPLPEGVRMVKEVNHRYPKMLLLLSLVATW